MNNNSNNTAALNEQLFAVLRNLNTEIKGEDLKEEIGRAKAVAEIGKVIVANNNTVLDAMKMVQDGKVYAEQVRLLIGN